jgi:hypothetical protein
LLFHNDLDLNNQKILCLPSIYQFERTGTNLDHPMENTVWLLICFQWFWWAQWKKKSMHLVQAALVAAPPNIIWWLVMKEKILPNILNFCTNLHMKKQNKMTAIQKHFAYHCTSHAQASAARKVSQYVLIIQRCKLRPLR